MKYRAEIDGLRALAVVPVILFHAGFELFRGGFVGVDVFFVISGYLITTILVDDIENNRFSIINFYEGRVRRILPALFLVTLVCIPFAWMWMLPAQMKDFSQSLVAVSLFASNILFWHESGYFAAAAEEMPLLHTWSLAVEEQFYVLFPVFLFLAWRFGKNTVFWMIVVFAAISLGLSEWGWRNNAAANFYLAPTRAWELFAGSIVAFVVQKRGVQANDALSLLGLAAILIAIFAYNERTPFPSLYTLVPVSGVVLLIMFADKETLVAKLLSTKLLVGIGLISYSAYLWHQPLFAYARIFFDENPSSSLMLFLSCLSIWLAVVSWRYVETPFRNRKNFSRATVFSAALVTSVLLVGLGVSGHLFHNDILRFKYANNPNFLTSYRLLEEARSKSPVFINENRYDNGKCRFSVLNLDSVVSKRLEGCVATFGKGVLVIGDSHATNLYHSLVRNPSNGSHQFLVGITKNGCHLPTDKKGCQYVETLEFLNQHPSAFKDVLYEKAGYLILGFPGPLEYLRIPDKALVVKSDNDVVRGVGDYLQKLAEFSSVTWFGPRLVPLVSETEYLNFGCEHQYVPSEQHLDVYAQLDLVLKTFSENRKWRYVSQIDNYRFSFPGDYGNCERLLWMDMTHFSESGEKFFGERFNLLEHIKN